MKNFVRLLGVQSDTTPHKEKIISAVGGFLGIFFILIVTRYFLPDAAAALIVASMGASAVLLFAVPHGPLSQPWPLFGGHVLSALIGVSVRLLVPDMFVAAAIAVGLSIGMMYYLRCIHPPGGATALAAVVSGEGVYALGYEYVLTPVMLNVMVIMMTAILVNYIFPWRRYPVVLAMDVNAEPQEAPCRYRGEGIIPRRDLEYALKSMQSFADITEQELEKIYQKARQHGRELQLKTNDIRLGHYYSHGSHGDELVIRRIIDESQHDNPAKDMVIYKVVSGPDLYATGTATRAEFARWAKHEVEPYGQQWQILTNE